ncbi:peptide deformylase, partial [Candidatus Woesearchaeota archaeon]|nr:peptide deformylase [Candidatus Woesearchaeota archaeon]
SGLAANQLGIRHRILVFKMIGNKIITLLNPVIISSSIPFFSLDMCASMPGILKIKKRCLIIRIRYIDLKKKENYVTLYGSIACTMQHELDHLDGKLIVD